MHAKSELEKVKAALADPEKIVVIQTAPAVRVAIGEGFGYEPGTFLEGKMVGALRALGADYVVDTNFGADLTIMEEASELVDRLNKGGQIPQFTSCCPAWVRFAEIYFPELLPNLSSTRSCIAMEAAMIKTYFAEKKGIDPHNIVAISVNPCTAKKQKQNVKKRMRQLVSTTTIPLAWIQIFPSQLVSSSVGSKRKTSISMLLKIPNSMT